MKSYINRFFSLKSAVGLLPFFQLCSSPAKEVTESMACWRAAIDILKLSPKEPVNVLVVGDGRTPRTAALFAHLAKWNTVSIDPEMDLERYEAIKAERASGEYPIRNMTVLKVKVEALLPHVLRNYFWKDVQNLLVLPHSHAQMKDAVKLMEEVCGNFHVINMPCCTPVPECYISKSFTTKVEFHYYSDEDCWSPERQMYIWKGW